MIRALRRIATYKIPHIDRTGLYLPSFVALGCYAWWKTLPVLPGYAIAGLAFVAVVMTVRADKFETPEKVLWVLMGAGLLFAELQVLKSDRAESEIQQAAERQTQETRFEETVGELKKLLTEEQIHFDATAKIDRRLLKKAIGIDQVASASLANITGGSSYAYVYPKCQILDRVHIACALFIHNAGKQILTGVAVVDNIVVSGDVEKKGYETTLKPVFRSTLTVGTMAPGWGEPIPGAEQISELPPGQQAVYELVLDTPNGGEIEHMYLRRSQDGIALEYKFHVNARAFGKRKAGDLFNGSEWARKVMTRDWTDATQELRAGGPPIS